MRAATDLYGDLAHTQFIQQPVNRGKGAAVRLGIAVAHGDSLIAADADMSINPSHFVEILAAQQTNEGMDWYQGTADAIYQNINLVEQAEPDIVAIFGADHIYRTDPRQMVAQHLAHGAGITVAGSSDAPVISADPFLGIRPRALLPLRRRP